jgi:hypothetical protein
VRFIIIHKTNAHWETGAKPSPELIARVGSLMGELAAAGVLLGAEGLRPSFEGVRLKFSGGKRVVIDGPFEAGNELPAGFTILRTRSISDAIEWASRQAEALGDLEIDIRPVTEPWDIGLGSRPEDDSTRRYMVLRKTSAATEADGAPFPAQRTELARLIAETTRTGVHMVTESFRPSARGRRYKNSRNGISVFDGPFIETTEMIGGYAMVRAQSLAEAGRWAERYITAVQAEEVDVFELEDPVSGSVAARC